MTELSDPQPGDQPRQGQPDQPETHGQFWYEQQPEFEPPPRHGQQTAADESGPVPAQAPAPAEQSAEVHQPGYGAPSGYFGPPPSAATYGAAPRGGSVGVTGIAIVGIGAILLIVAFTAVNWFGGGAGTGTAHFSDVHDVLRLLDRFGNAAATPAKAYFAGLAWALFAVAVVAGVIANLPTPAAGAFRILGVLVAAGGITMTFLAIKLTKGTLAIGTATEATYGEYLKHAHAGFYLALGGFLLAGIGAALGPRRM